jgi:hypothetical protein
MQVIVIYAKTFLQYIHDSISEAVIMSIYSVGFLFPLCKVHGTCGSTDRRHFAKEPCPEVHLLTSDTGTERKLLVCEV